MANPSSNKEAGQVDILTAGAFSAPAGLERSARGLGARIKDRGFRGSLNLSVLFVFGVSAAMIISLFIISIPAIKQAGWQIFLGSDWDPDNQKFGGFPFVVSTLLTSILALIISLPFSLSVALFLGEYYKKGLLSNIMTAAIELLAGIPSIIYGMFGLFVLVPIIQQWEVSLAPLGVIPLGVGILTASILLAIMIIPYSASIAREVISLVPLELKEAAYSLGGSRFSVVRLVSLPYAFSGIFAGQLLAFGRALGETLAVAMVIGNQNIMPGSMVPSTGNLVTDALNVLLSTGATVASVIANEYPEASDIHIAALTEIGLILFVITILFGFIGRVVINRFGVRGSL